VITPMIDILKAAFSNNVDLIRQAIVEGCDVNASHPLSGRTPLYIAVVSSSTGAVQELLMAGAVPDQRFDLISRTSKSVLRKQTALMHAKSVEVVDALLSAGADINAVDADGWTPLVWAIHQAYSPVVVELLKRGASTSLQFFYQERQMTIKELPSARISRVEEIAGPQPNAGAIKLLSDLRGIRSAIHSVMD
jgi:uncharacterized protein